MNLRVVDKSESLVEKSRKPIDPEISVEALGENRAQIHLASQSKKKELTNHKSNIHGVKNECPTCYKFFKNLKHHQWSNHSEFHCILCDKKMLRSSQRKHMKTVHEEKKFQCKQCDTLLTSWDDLRT